MSRVKVKFWGVRGSVPTPLTSGDLTRKYRDLLGRFHKSGMGPEEFVAQEAVRGPLTYGGNTSCVSVHYEDETFVLDMGTGIRSFGNSLFPQMIKDGGLRVNFVVSHVHWDHIQGLPFFGPLYASKEGDSGVKNQWTFYGGTRWQETAEICMKHQMDPPRFPVSWEEIEATTHRMEFYSVHHGLKKELDGSGVVATFGKLNHPQETYGVRLTFPDGQVVVYTTDNEPFDPHVPDPRLVALARGADLWITDCQYTQSQYNGQGGPPRHGWGHSYPEAVAGTARQAEVKRVVLFHHDPGSSDEKIEEIARYTQNLVDEGDTKVIAAFEGLELIA